MKQEHLMYAVKQFCEKENGIRPQFVTPSIHGDYIVATDGHALLCAPKEGCPIEPFVSKEDPKFNALGVINLTLKPTHLLSVQELDASCENVDSVKIDGAYYLVEQVFRIVKFAKLLGVTTYGACRDKDCEMLFVNTAFGLVRIIVMRSLEKYGLAREIETPAIDLDTRYDCNEAEGERFYEQCLKEDKMLEEEHNKRNFKVYEVTLAKYTTIAIKASNKEQAMRAARRVDIDYWDVEGDWEVDGYEETCRDDAESDYDRVFDEDGNKCDWEEFDEDEEEDE